MEHGRSAFGAFSPTTQGVLWSLLATGSFALVAALAKLSVESYHVLQILFFRQIVVFLTTLPQIAAGFPDSLKTRHQGWHALRLLGAFVALSAGIWAVAVLPLTTAVTLGFVQVFLVAVLAGWILAEPVGINRMIAIIGGFGGVLIILNPGLSGIADVHALIPILGALGAAVAVIAVRHLSQTETTATLLVYQSVFVGVLAAVPLIWLWQTPDLFGFILLFGMGGIAAVGQWAGIQALRLAEASVIGSLQYVQLIHAAILGFVFFGEIPDLRTLTGAALIIASALWLIHREARSRRG